ncbi:serine/threonine protein kinase [Kibdelosporangium philippinense]|uniref:non-specific serine/threonine protein kinase n=1 Tax=Kibdelosporangium philippinense TaxID=211113 RepID=A0ABS8ZID0_9PSEU|nr:serine/threonine-protein kinase [Kibdelosporangium philippinense]MCE7007564.1 serine/threonine protein kinase [Kibdelosporangium philippinense]
MDRGDHLGAGRYRVLEELGRGGMGVVWLAEDLTIGRRVAIKELLLPHNIAPQERQVFEERVMREARTAGRLNDPAIVTVHDVVREHGSTFLVMELIDAKNLSDVVAQHGPIPVDQVLSIAEQLLSALEAAHRANIVHRDVKPSNVMLDANGRVKLTDFGIAQSIEDPKLTSSGTLIGSPTYISPERLLGQEASPASDLWALGATLFFAVEGYGAYERPSTPAAIQAIMNERVQLRRAHGPLANLIMGLLDPDPRTRLNGGQVRYLIDQARQHATAGVQQGPVPTTKPMPKNKRGAVIAVVAVVLIVALGAVLVFSGVFESKQKQEAAGPQTSGQQPSENPTSESSTSAKSTPPPATAGGNRAATTKTYGEDGEITNLQVVMSGEPGTCFIGLDLNEPKFDCTVEHDTEIFGQFQLNRDSGDYPGEQSMVKEAEAECKSQFDGLAGKDKLKLWTLIPTKTAWEDLRRRKALCVVSKEDRTRMTGSVKGN